MEQVRAALGGGWQRLPTVDAATLRRYYRYLSQNLSLPFPAWYPEAAFSDAEGEHACTVTELIDPATGLGDEFDGIFCKVVKGKQERLLPLIELQLPPDGPNFHLVEHYWDWFWHWRVRISLIPIGRHPASGDADYPAGTISGTR